MYRFLTKFLMPSAESANDVGLWAPAAARTTVEDSATFWTKVVGVDAVRSFDITFRLFAWGRDGSRVSHVRTG